MYDTKYLFYFIHLTEIPTPTNSQQACTTPNKIYYDRNTGNYTTTTSLHIINNACIKTNSYYFKIFILIKNNYENKTQVIAKYPKDSVPIIIAGNFEYNNYKTVVKSLATIDMEIMELTRIRQEITKMQSQLIQEKKSGTKIRYENYRKM